MEVMRAITSRRAVRDYTDALVPAEEIRALIEAAVLAPSARNLQPWSFAVLLDRNQIEGCADQAKQWLLENRAAEIGAFTEMLNEPGYSLFHHAPALVVVLATDDTQQSAEDCCLAAQTLMLAARARNLGTCWIGLARPWLNLETTKAELGLPSAYQAVAPIVIGHPKNWPEPHERKPPEINWLGR
jgi:nitroreductase